MSDVLKSSVEAGIARVTLNRPGVRNAFNAELIAELRAEFDRLGEQDAVRAIVLGGEGSAFCGGADVNWMRSALDLSYDENLADAEAMSDMFRAIDRCPKPVVARLHGAALGGGAGLAAVSDVAIASDDSVFGFIEVKLGIIPAVISPFVIAKIGVSHARELFVTGRRFDAAYAKEIGLVHAVVTHDDLDASIDGILGELRTSGPKAIAAVKNLIPTVSDATYDGSRTVTTSAIARLRIGEEGQEGLRSFLERRAAGFAR
jgi:methylglutaconyl-CoA hydratase